jgi:hypothetical protein
MSAALLDAPQAQKPAATHPESKLDALAEQLVATWPALDADRKRELGRLLAAS